MNRPIYREVVIDRNTIDQTCIGGDQWCEEDFEDPEEDEEENEGEEDGEEEEEDEAEEIKAQAEKQKLPVIAAKAPPKLEPEIKPQPAKPGTLQSAPPVSTALATTTKAPAISAPTIPATTAQASIARDRAKDPIIPEIIIDDEIKNRPLPEIKIDLARLQEPSLNEARLPGSSYKVNRKKPPKTADPVAMRNKFRAVALDWIPETVNEKQKKSAK